MRGRLSVMAGAVRHVGEGVVASWWAICLPTLDTCNTSSVAHVGGDQGAGRVEEWLVLRGGGLSRCSAVPAA